jgi:hypothetical protein
MLNNITTEQAVFSQNVHFTVKMEALWPSETLLSYDKITRHHNSEDLD